jgi:type I restriction enzyme S subunit
MKPQKTKFKETEIGPIPEEGGFVRLGDIANIQQGKYLSPNLMVTIPSASAMIPVWGANGVIGYTDKPTFEEVIPLVTCRGNGCGLVQWTGGPAYISNNAMAIVIPLATQEDNLFLYYSLLSTDFQDVTTGSAQPQITMGHLINKQIPWQEVAQARSAIASILSSLDDKIELNRKINANLEKIASALFKRWFVDFEFPNEKGKPYKSSGGKMVESELGEIPEGWGVGTLGDEFEVVMGQSPKGDTYNEVGTGLPFYQGRTDFGQRFPSLRVYCTDPKRMAQPLDTLVSVRAPVGDINMAIETSCIGRGVAAIRKKGYSSFVFYQVKTLKPLISEFDAEGTVFGSINKDALSGLRFTVPADEAMSKFEELVKEVDKQIFNLNFESISLKEACDSLLPRLMSGRIRV